MMSKPPVLPVLREAVRTKGIRRQKILAEMDKAVSCIRFPLPDRIEPHYPKAGRTGGRPPMSLETMQRGYVLRIRSALSDPRAEDESYDGEAMRRFARIKLGDDRIPDETTLLHVRPLPDHHGPTQALFGAGTAGLADTGRARRAGPPVDATIRPAPSAPQTRIRNSEMSSTQPKTLIGYSAGNVFRVMPSHL